MDLERLAQGMARLELDLDAEEQRATLAAYGMLAGGHAFTARSLADRIGWSRDRAATFLERFPRLERDGLDRVVGVRGVSLRRTSHAVVAGHQVLYGWSAWDCLVVPLVIDAAVQVRSTCPVTDREVELIVTPEEIRRCAPDTTHVSLRAPETVSPEEERGGSRAASRFLVDAEAGRRWTQRLAHAVLLDLRDGFEVARGVVRRSFPDVMDRRQGA